MDFLQLFNANHVSTAILTAAKQASTIDCICEDKKKMLSYDEFRGRPYHQSELRYKLLRSYFAELWADGFLSVCSKSRKHGYCWISVTLYFSNPVAVDAARAEARHMV
jgi:hypothetical protein